MENQVKVITMSAKEIVVGKTKFVTCTSNICGKWYKIKFLQNCDGAPKERGIYELKIDFDNCSVQAGRKRVDGKGKEYVENDTIWVHKIIELRPYTEEDYKQRTRTAMADIFNVSNHNEKFDAGKGRF